MYLRFCVFEAGERSDYIKTAPKSSSACFSHGDRGARFWAGAIFSAPHSLCRLPRLERKSDGMGGDSVHDVGTILIGTWSCCVGVSFIFLGRLHCALIESNGFVSEMEGESAK